MGFLIRKRTESSNPNPNNFWKRPKCPKAEQTLTQKARTVQTLHEPLRSLWWCRGFLKLGTGQWLCSYDRPEAENELYSVLQNCMVRRFSGKCFACAAAAVCTEHYLAGCGTLLHNNSATQIIATNLAISLADKISFCFDDWRVNQVRG